MELRCDGSWAIGYKSLPQQSRVISERWFRENAYCLACTSNLLQPTPNNTKAADFQCQSCAQHYELKTFRRQASKIVDGAFSSMMSRIESGCAPTLMLLERTLDWRIQNLTAIHYIFVTPDVIEKRPPLSATARRAGWTGCNIRLDLVASDARIGIIQAGAAIDPAIVRANFRRYEGLRAIPGNRRGWTTLALDVVRRLRAQQFTLDQVYAYEQVFAQRFPNNRHVRPKIRQQLQVLRDLGYLEFHGRGRYRVRIQSGDVG